MDDQATLRPVRETDLPFLEGLTNDPAGVGEFLWDGWHDPNRLRRRLHEDGMVGQDRGQLMIVLGEEQLGFVSWFKMPTGPNTHCWNMGVMVAPEARGQGYGTQGQRQLVRYLFLHSQLNRIEAETEIGNIAEQRSLEKAGFTREGVRRGVGFRAGQWRDGVHYGIVRADVEL
jgi:RimJ/RimL family protein N-acetyltransferase